MKEWIERVKKDRSVTVDGKPADKHMTNIGLNDIIDKLIAEIEFLETKIKQLDIGLIARTLLKQENEQLQAVCEAAEKIEYSKITENGEDGVFITEYEWMKFQQALAAKDNE